jgi:hypothetical protein
MYAGGALVLFVTAAASVGIYGLIQENKVFKDMTTDNMKELASELADLLPQDKKQNIHEAIKNSITLMNSPEGRKVFSEEFRENRLRGSLVSIIGLATMQVRQSADDGKNVAAYILYKYGLTTDEYGRIKKEPK